MIARLQQLLLLGQLLLALATMAWLGWGLGWHPAAAIAAGLAAPIAAHAALLAAGFLLAAAAGGPRPPGAVRGLGPWLRAWAVEVVDSIRTFTWAQPLLALRPWPEPTGPRRIPVLLVHGYFCNRAVWLPMAARLAAAGHPVAGLDLEPPFSSIDEHVPSIDEAVDRLKRQAGTDRIALVCHSMGGLAARAYLRRHGDGSVAHVVTLGTPHRGTVHARLGLGTCVQQMRRDSEWLLGLARDEPAERRARFTLIRTWQDNMVAPHAIQQLDGARIVDFGGIGHVTLAYDRQVQDRILETLRVFSTQYNHLPTHPTEEPT
jgi:triacylglycerol esterase/lipase EstA (alpha/beta hydrolase family)